MMYSILTLNDPACGTIGKDSLYVSSVGAFFLTLLQLRSCGTPFEATMKQDGRDKHKNSFGCRFVTLI
jgi:hypothetical protein